jgi:alpha-amylase
MTSFVDNHDVARFTNLVANGASDESIAAIYHLALGANFTLPGIPELMWGDEFAMKGGVDPDNRRDMPEWGWSAKTRAGSHQGFLGDGAESYAFVKKLIAIRREHRALQVGSYAELWRQNGGAANVLAFHRGVDDARSSEHLIVAINNGASAANVDLRIATSDKLDANSKSMMRDGRSFDDVLAQRAPKTVTITNGMLAISIPAQAMAIYVMR